MDSVQNALKIDKLRDDNFHVWKHRVQLVLALSEADEFIEDDPPLDTDPEYKAWLKGDRKAQAIIGLTLSDSVLEQVQHATTAKEMWEVILDIYEKHTLLNKLAARRRFYTATMNDGEKVLGFASRIRQLAATLKSMGVTIDDSEMAMALLNGLPDRFDGLISALDALGNDEKLFTFEFVKSRCQQEEQRHAKRDEDARIKSETAALVARPARKLCDCGKHYDPSRCYLKYPELAPPDWHRRNKDKGLIGKEDTSDSEICLFGMEHEEPCEDPPSAPDTVCLAALEKAFPGGSKHWFLDSGCTSHMTYDRQALSSFSEIESSVDFGSGSSKIVGQGTVVLQVRVKGDLRKCTIRNVKYVPTLKYQLLSVRCMAKLGTLTTFDVDAAFLRRKSDSKLVATGSIAGGLYALDTTSLASGTDVALVADLRLWHQRLAHVSMGGIKSMAERGVVLGVKINPKDSQQDCVGCILGKSHRTPIPRTRSSRATKLLERVHSDVLGPLEVASVGGSKYIISFIDDYSNWTTEYTMRKKSEALDRFKRYKAHAETHTNQVLKTLQIHEYRFSVSASAAESTKLKILRSDNGGEYLSDKFRQYLDDSGIKHELTVAYTPQQNGVAERMNRTLLDLVRSMLHHHGIEKRFWAEALATAVYVRNRVTSRALGNNVTPHHLWHGQAPDLSHMRVFGARCWYVLPRAKVKKLDPRAREAVMMGYSAQSKGYKLWDVESKKFVVSRDVRFDESRAAVDKTAEVEGESVAVVDITQDNNNNVNDSSQVEPTEQPSATASNQDEAVVNTPAANVDNNSQPPASSGPRRSSRQSKPPGAWWVATSSSPTNDNNLVSIVSSDIALIAHDVPQSYSEAMSPDNIDFWAPGIQREEDCIRENNTFTLVERQPGMHVLPCRYVFKVKNSGPKVRIVAKGFRQVHGVDYHETFAPVISLASVRCLLAIVARLDLELYQMDVVTAFLNGELDEVIYMEVPAGFRDPNRPNLVCKLLKALYGLKQAPRQWYAKINTFLCDELKFTSCPYEPCLYYKHDERSMMLIALYVDDLLIAGNDLVALQRVKADFARQFKMKDLGEAAEFLGMRIVRDRSKHSLHLTQSDYIDSVLERFRMSDSKPVSTPMELPAKGHSLETPDPNDLPTDAPYRAAVGCLIWLMIGTRPDIGYAVGRLAQHNENPLESHWTAVKRVLRYLKSTRKTGLTYCSDQTLHPVGYCDSDWASCRESRKSTAGFVFLLGGGAVCWKSKKQSIVAASSCEAEYIAAFPATKEAVWLSRLLAGMLGKDKLPPIVLKIDNQGAIATAKGTGINNRNKHIDMRYHFTRDAVGNKQVAVEYVRSNEQAADPLTKPLLREAHIKTCAMMGLQKMAKSES